MRYLPPPDEMKTATATGAIGRAAVTAVWSAHWYRQTTIRASWNEGDRAAVNAMDVRTSRFIQTIPSAATQENAGAVHARTLHID